MVDDRKVRRIVLLSFLGIGIIIFLSIITMVIKNIEKNNYKVVIDNIDVCAKNISDGSKNELFSKTYIIVKEQNSVNDREIKKTYHGIIRDGSCKTRQYDSSNKISFGTDAIIDIEELGYSYGVTFAWVTNDAIQVDIGTPEYECLDLEQLIYGDFGCSKNGLMKLYGRGNEITSILPYFGDDYMLSVSKSETSKSGYAIILVFDPSSSVYESNDIGAFMKQKTEEAMNYLKEKGIDIDDYEIIKQFKIIE